MHCWVLTLGEATLSNLFESRNIPYSPLAYIFLSPLSGFGCQGS